MTVRHLLAVLLVALALGMLPAGEPAPLPPGIARELWLATLRGEEEITLLVILRDAAWGRLERAVRLAQGAVVGGSAAGDFAVVRVPLARAGELLRRWRELGMEEVSLDRPLGAAAAGQPGPDRTEAAAAMVVNLRAIRAAEFVEETGSTGRGITIAVIDTGVDPSHSDLQLTSSWLRKLTDWVDFTGEGDVIATVTVRSTRGGWVETPLGRVNLGRIPSQSGRYRLGVFREAQLAEGPLGRDLNRNGVGGDSFLVLVTDAAVAGVYDTVYVDTNGNRDFADEVGLGEFRREFQHGYFAPRPEAGRSERVPFVVTRISPDGERVNLGFDANGHGTHVAAVAAAFGAYRGGANGVAPGARVMALKALGAGGDGYWSDIALAMTHAAEHGADIILLSLTGAHDAGELRTETELMRRLAERHGVRFVVAAGNQGPGLGTFNAPGDPALTLSVGAYMSPEMWRVHYGYEVAEEGLWHFSSAGPRADGGLGPLTVSPGVATAAAPYWLSATGYARFEGTSQAVPHLGGLVALVLEEARSGGRNVDPATLCRAVERGSRPLATVPLARQGYGLAEVPRVWKALETLPPAIFPVTVEDRQAGLYLRGGQTAAVVVEVGNLAGQPRRLEVAGPTWVAADRRRLTLPAGLGRRLHLELGLEGVPGLYESLLVLDDPFTPGREVTLPLTVALPHRFPEEMGTLILEGTLGAAGAVHHFLEVPPGTGRLELTLTVPRGAGGLPAGQVRLHVLRPDGRELVTTGEVGYTEEGEAVDRVVQVITHPVPGVWELVVASSPGISRHNLRASRFRLEAAARGLVVDPPRLVLAGASERELSLTLNLENRYGPVAVRVLGWGLGPDGQTSRVTLHALRAGGTFATALPSVAANSAYLRVEVGNPSAQGVELSLYLYRREPDGRWTEVAVDSGRGVRAGLELHRPPPGDYVVYVEGTGFTGETTFELRYLIVQDSGQVSASGPPRLRQWGERWTVPVAVRVPDSPGEHHGLVLVQEVATGELLAVVPVLVVTGRPALELEAWAPPLQTGRRERLVVRVREADSGLPVDTVVEIDGRRVRARGGEAAWWYTPGAVDLEFRVTVHDVRYAPAAARFCLPVGRPGLPSLPWAGPELEDHRQKVRNFLLSPRVE